MTKFADEMRGSEGERCIVTDLRTGTRHKGEVVAWNENEHRATVRYDNGKLVKVSHSFVELIGDEKP